MLRPGTRVAGRWEVVGSLGRAPTHDELIALDHEVEVEVALWVIAPALVPDEAWRRRLVAGAQAARAAAHPALRKLFAAGVHDGHAFVALARLPGDTLDAHIAAGVRVSTEELSRLGGALADALAALHAGGHAHGWLRAADVTLIAGGEPRLSGAGLWAHVEPRALLQAHLRAGAGVHIAPELRAGGRADAATDVYGLALLFAELALGERAPAGAGAAAMIDRLERRRPELAAALAPALSDEPALRPVDPLLLVRRLAQHVSGLPTPTGGQAYSLTTAELAPISSVSEDEATSHYAPVAPAPGDDEALDPIIEPPSLSGRMTPIPLTHRKGGTPILPLPAVDTPVPPGAVVPARPSTPGPVSPRAPTHRPASQMLPALAADPARVTLTGTAPRTRVKWFVGLAGLTLIAAVGVLAVRASGSRGSRPGAAAAAVDAGPARAGLAADAGAPGAGLAGDAGARALAPCPPHMVPVAARPSFCIDVFEAPGEGFTPATSVTLAQASAACVARGKRLCRADEWERACRGPGGASWPYGDRFAAGVCNVRGGSGAALEVAGKRVGCVSAAGARDMAGNAAEWVTTAPAGADPASAGELRGGSAASGDGRCSRETAARRDKAAADVGYRCCSGLIGS